MTGSRKPFLSLLAAVPLGVASFSEATMAAQPRPLVGVQSGAVRLSDLFSGLEPGQDCEIGPAPAPGGRIVIEQPQLAAIATQFGVDWQPGMLPARVILERKARLMTREEILPLVRSALASAGAPEDSEVSFSTRAALMVPAEAAGRPEIDS